MGDGGAEGFALCFEAGAAGEGLLGEVAVIGEEGFDCVLVEGVDGFAVAGEFVEDAGFEGVSLVGVGDFAGDAYGEVSYAFYEACDGAIIHAFHNG